MLPEHHAPIVSMDGDWRYIGALSPDNPAGNILVDNLAYVIYTSGSTGKPKAVQITHRGLLNLIGWHLSKFQITKADKATQFSAIAFDAMAWELWPYLAAGASIEVVPDETRTSPEQLRDWVVSRNITVTFLPTPLAETVLALGWHTDAPLRYMLTGGDTLHSYPSPALRFDLVNNYGPTENTVVATSGMVPKGENTFAAPSIGRPIFNSDVYLLDQHLRPVPVGLPGELHIGGASLARGYLNDPVLTAGNFIPNGFGDDDAGARLYRTGDLARYRSDAEIEFLGRIDHQVKIRGFRIELGDIQAALNSHPAVRDAVVVATGHSGDSRRLIAYFVPVQRQVVTPADLRTFVRSQLPEYMIPSSFVIVDQFPLTSNGKVDRNALSRTDDEDAHQEQPAVPPGTGIELEIASILEDVLGVRKIGINDNFFDAGANSLLIIRVVNKLRNALNTDVSVIEFFTYPTVNLLANHLGQQQPSEQEEKCLDPILKRAELRRKALGW